jgi:hypothetical protein
LNRDVRLQAGVGGVRPPLLREELVAELAALMGKRGYLSPAWQA